jgi:hypothetical protein
LGANAEEASILRNFDNLLPGKTMSSYTRDFPSLSHVIEIGSDRFMATLQIIEQKRGHRGHRFQLDGAALADQLKHYSGVTIRPWDFWEREPAKAGESNDDKMKREAREVEKVRHTSLHNRLI